MSLRNAISSVKRTKTCVFCGNSVRNKKTNRQRACEHVFPAWVLDQFGVGRESIEFSPMEAARDDGHSLQMTVQTPIRHFDLNNFLLGAVCSTCNNGWMSRLETRIKPILENLAADTSAKIGEQKALAKWAIKTAYVLSRYLKPPVGRIPEKHGQQLVGDGLGLPKGVVVFHRQAADWRIWFSLCMSFDIRGVDSDAVQSRYQNAYKFLIQIGYAQFLVQYYPNSQIEIGYDPTICMPLDAHVAVFADPEFRVADSGITDPNFLFMMSNSIWEKDLPRVGRNDLCPCGSTLKFKHCHGATGIHLPTPPSQDWV